MSICQTRTFSGQFPSLAAIGEFVIQAAEVAALDPRATYAVQMAVDEACSNIIEHSYEGENIGEIECTYEVTPKALIITLRDQGACFDPTHVSDPDLDADLQDRTRGGLGIYFIRQLMDRVEHEFSLEQGNVLTLVKHKESAP